MISKICVVLVSLLLTAAHPIHVGICELHHNKKNSSIELTFKLFTDDVEKAIEKSTGKKILLGNPKESPEAKQLIGNYVVQHFLAKNHNNAIKLGYLGFEQDNDQLFIYFEGAVKGKPDKLEFIFNPLTEVYEDQSNIMHMTVMGTKKSLYFNTDKQKLTVEF